MKNLLVLLTMIVVSVALTACGDGEGPTSPDVALAPAAAPSPAGSAIADSSSVVVGTSRGVAAASGMARIRAAHLSTDAPAVDIWVDGQVVLSNVPFKAVSDYLELPAGEYRFQVTPAGATSPIVIDATVPLEGSTVYTLAAVGFLNSTIEPLLLVDSLRIGDGARIRVVHASADTGAVDVAVSGGPVLFGDLTYQEASAYGEVPGGVYDLEVRPAGSSSVALAIPGLEVSDATTYTVFAIGRSFNETLQALPVVDTP